MEPNKIIQDPNTPRYDPKTGLTTDYGKYLKLPEVNTINSTNLQTPIKTDLTGITNSTTNIGNPAIDGSVIAISNSVKTEADRIKETERLNLENKNLLDQLAGVNTAIGNVSSNVDRRAQDASQKQVDFYSKEIETEQKNLRRKLEETRKTFGGSTAGLQDELGRIERDSLSKQADSALALSGFSRDVATASAIADRQVAINLEKLTAQAKNLDLYIKNNRDRFTLEESRLYNEKQREIENNLKKQTENENVIKEMKLTMAANQAPVSVLNKLSAIDTTKPGAFDEALKVASPYLAKADTDIVKLENGNTVVIDKKGNIIKNLYGAKASGQTFVQRTVNTVDGKKPVSGYTIKPGDDNNIIAQLYGTDIATIKKLNPDVKDWNNLQVGQSINIPISKEDEFINLLKTTEGGSKLTDTSIQKLDKGLTVLNQLGVLQANIQDVKTGPIVGLFKGANPWDTKAQTIKTSLNAIVPNLARGIYGEVGVLTDNDIRTYSKTIPNLKSTDDVRNAVLYITLDMIGKSIKNTLNVNAAAGRDVSGFIDIYTEMESAKNSILSTIPGAQIPNAFNKTQTNGDPFLSKFTPEYVSQNISNSSFFNQL